jgi:AraC-like DNA-binding protein
MSILTHTVPVHTISDSLKKFHLATVETARAYILENFGRDISLSQLSQHCLVSPFHFSRIFKSIMNIPPHQYLAAVRLNHAKVLLTTTDMSVFDIAFACNFSSTEHFSTAYKKHFKINPAAQRKQMI